VFGMATGASFQAEAWVPGPLGVTGAFVTKWGFPWA